MKIFQIVYVLALCACALGSQHKRRQYRARENSKLFVDDDRVKFITASNEASFFVIGDWGGLPVFPYRTIIENSVSKQMTNLAQEHNAQFQLALGDNFYFNGVRDAEDKRFAETYEKVFNSEYLTNTSWFVLLGNHDHYGNASAQVEYSKKSDRWVLPSFNYTIDLKINDGDEELAKIIMIDTVLMCGNSGLDWELDKEPKLKTVRDQHLANEYFDWVENELIEAQDYPYIIVAGHFPVWSIAEHGPTKCLVDRLRPLLHKYRVSAYMCGHDHNLQHINTNYLNSTVDYLLIGASNFVDNSTDHMNSIPEGSLKFHWADSKQVVNGGFGLTKINRNNMTVTYFESNGNELHQAVILPRN